MSWACYHFKQVQFVDICGIEKSELEWATHEMAKNIYFISNYLINFRLNSFISLSIAGRNRHKLLHFTMAASTRLVFLNL